MVQLSDDCFAFGDALLPLEEALSRLLAGLTPLLETETISLHQALGRVLSNPVIAAINVPNFDNSAVDGYAFRHADLREGEETPLPIAGRLPAGAVNPPALKAGTAYRIFTGAPMPPGADTVMMQEDCRQLDDVSDLGGVILAPGIKQGANTRAAGEDMTVGEMVLRPGLRLDPQSIGAIAAQGFGSVTVYRRLRIALLSTGDEIAAPSSLPKPEGSLKTGQLFDANRSMLTAALQALGGEVTDLGIVADDPVALTQALREAAQEADVIVTSGGMSTGEEDHIRAVIEAEGRLDFWRLAIKPGRPVGFGWLPVQRAGAGVRAKEERCALIGLPGNPVAAFTTFAVLARPFMLKLSGVTEALSPRCYKALLGFDYKKKTGRREFVRVQVDRLDELGRPILQKYGKSGAAMLTSLIGADGFADIDEARADLKAGDLVDFIPFAELMR